MGATRGTVVSVADLPESFSLGDSSADVASGCCFLGATAPLFAFAFFFFLGGTGVAFFTDFFADGATSASPMARTASSTVASPELISVEEPLTFLVLFFGPTFPRARPFAGSFVSGRVSIFRSWNSAAPSRTRRMTHCRTGTPPSIRSLRWSGYSLNSLATRFFPLVLLRRDLVGAAEGGPSFSLIFSAIRAASCASSGSEYNACITCSRLKCSRSDNSYLVGGGPAFPLARLW
mmetsp:Transcript_30570/g.87334  ORF Transcript_30570/g.87334 Transcript_30570/m.87334 type:complete len:234 (-) Transcript_30570:369-1070(-)